MNKKVIARRDAGLGDNLLATAHAWYYAQQTGRDLEINWAPSMYFKTKSKNSFGYFFVVPAKIGNVRIIYNENIPILKRIARRIPFTPFKYYLASIIGEITHKFLREKTPKFIKDLKERRRNWLIQLIEEGKDIENRTIVFNSHFDYLDSEKIKPFFDEIKLIPELQQKVNDFKKEKIKNKKVIGVHVRYYDKSLPYSNHTHYWLDPEKSFQHIKNEIEKIIDRLDNEDYVVYLSTDNIIVFDFFKLHIKNLVTYNKQFQNITFTLSMHHKVAEGSFGDDLIEMFLLAESDVLFRYPPSGSWFSYYGSLYAGEVVI